MSRTPLAGYSTAQVSALAGLHARRVRALARDGVVSPVRGPRGALRFTVADLVVLRAARTLADELPARAWRRALRRVRAQLPASRTLAGVRLTADRGGVLAREGGAAWRPDTGQQLLAFDAAGPSAPVARMAARTRPAEPAPGVATAEDWFALGCDLEARAPAEAVASYRRTLALDPAHVAARLNLGRLLHEHGDPAGAAAEYARALDADPAEPVAAFNLGVALEDLGDEPAAAEAYRRALALDARHADAHFNLALLLEKTGDRRGALRHLSAYRRLVRR